MDYEDPQDDLTDFAGGVSEQLKPGHMYVLIPQMHVAVHEDLGQANVNVMVKRQIPIKALEDFLPLAFNVFNSKIPQKDTSFKLCEFVKTIKESQEDTDVETRDLGSQMLDFVMNLSQLDLMPEDDDCKETIYGVGPQINTNIIRNYVQDSETGLLTGYQAVSYNNKSLYSMLTEDELVLVNKATNTNGLTQSLWFLDMAADELLLKPESNINSTAMLINIVLMFMCITQLSSSVYGEVKHLEHNLISNIIDLMMRTRLLSVWHRVEEKKRLLQLDADKSKIIKPGRIFMNYPSAADRAKHALEFCKQSSGSDSLFPANTYEEYIRIINNCRENVNGSEYYFLGENLLLQLGSVIDTDKVTAFMQNQKVDIPSLF